MSIRILTYREMSRLSSFNERYEYLRLNGKVGVDTFGFDRYMNQAFYKSREWRQVRDKVIIRDQGCDLGLEGYEIFGRIIIHHMNPIAPADIKDSTDFLLNPDFLVCVSNETHQAIHYGSAESLQKGPVQRRPNDTCPWKQ